MSSVSQCLQTKEGIVVFYRLVPKKRGPMSHLGRCLKKVVSIGVSSSRLVPTNISNCRLVTTNYFGRGWNPLILEQILYSEQKYKEYKLEEDVILLFWNKVYTPNSHELRNLVLKEMDNFPYVGHPGYLKTIKTVRSHYFWPEMKKYVTDYLDRCMEFQMVKDEHRDPMGLLQPLPILEWKWEVVTIDFITKFRMPTRQHDSIMVVLKKITKVVHFIPVKVTHKVANIAEIYMR
jgi:hypothetical protein